MNLNCCAMCRSAEATVVEKPGAITGNCYHYVCCAACGLRGPVSIDSEVAARLWNKLRVVEDE